MQSATTRHLRSALRLNQNVRLLASSSNSLLEILELVKNGNITPSQAQDRLQNTDETLRSFANLDYSRSNRAGFPEAVFAEGKTSTQIHSILKSMIENSSPETPILATRVSTVMYEDELFKFDLINKEFRYHHQARILEYKRPLSTNSVETSANQRRVVVATAGTTDIPVAEEAAVTLEATQACKVDRVYDVGVAGLHRVLRALPTLSQASCVIVAAGMDGALPSVVGGLVKVPVIAVPTSVGYGASFGGVSAMLTMMNSCSPGVGVVNIDNGFGAAALAYKCISL